MKKAVFTGSIVLLLVLGVYVFFKNSTATTNQTNSGQKTNPTPGATPTAKSASTKTPPANQYSKTS